jgi:hypothetical protein
MFLVVLQIGKAKDLSAPLRVGTSLAPELLDDGVAFCVLRFILRKVMVCGYSYERSSLKK